MTALALFAAAFAAIVVGLLYVNPTTGPFVRKFWWVLMLVLMSLLGLVVAVALFWSGDPKGRNAVAQQMSDRMDGIFDALAERDAMASLEIEAVRARTEKQRAATLYSLDEARRIPDPVERRKRLNAMLDQAEARRREVP